MMHSYKFYTFYRDQSLETEWKYITNIIINTHYYLLTEFYRLPTKIEILTDYRRVGPPIKTL